MPAPSCLDTSREDWRRQSTGKGTCRACDAEILWCSFADSQGHEIKRPYNYSDGLLHFGTCPDRRAFRTAKPIVQPEPKKEAEKPQAPQASLFAMTDYPD